MGRLSSRWEIRKQEEKLKLAEVDSPSTESLAELVEVSTSPSPEDFGHDPRRGTGSPSTVDSPSRMDTPLTPQKTTPRERMESKMQQLRMLPPAVWAAVCSMALGIAHPYFTELSKSAHLHEFEAGALIRDTRRVMPFQLITLTLASQTLAVLIAACYRIYVCGSFKVAACELLDLRELVVKFLPIGALYGVGDFLQTMACNKSSTPVVLLVGQSKLFFSALLSKFLLESQPNGTKWIRLLTISLATMASTDISANNAPVHSDEFYGALLALVKAVLSTTGAVWSERVYKGSGQTDFWVVSFRVQLSMLMTSLVVLLLTNNPTELWADGLFSGGPYPPCGPDDWYINCEGQDCVCSTSTGWDFWTFLAMVGIILNGYATGFFLKHLSAVCKAVCNLGSSGLCCVACWIMGFDSCTIGKVCVTCIVLLHSGDYAVEKARASTSAQRSDKVTGVADAEWTANYSKGPSGLAPKCTDP